MFIFLILILDRCTDGPFLETNQHIDEYALVGLRTLAVATRHITNQEYDMFNTKLAEAAQSLEAREAKIRVSKFAFQILSFSYVGIWKWTCICILLSIYTTDHILH